MFNRKSVYGVLCLLGIVLPYSQLIPWLVDNGLDIVLLVDEAAQLRIGAFAWLDVIVSALTLVVFIFCEGNRLKMPGLWQPVLGTCIVGVSLGLPLFLLLREFHLENVNTA